MSDAPIILRQQAICDRFGAPYLSAASHLKVGIAANVRTGLLPLNGLRHPPEHETTGWYIWAGEELPEADDFFQPLHVQHLAEWCPSVLPYLGLGAGWRFLLAPDHEDVWRDPSLLNG